MVNTYTTMMLAIQRWILVCRPHDAKRYGSIRFARAQLAFVFIISVLFNIPRFLEYRLTLEDGRAVREILPLSVNNVYVLLYKTILYYIVNYIIPVGVLITTACLLVNSNKASASKKRLDTANANSNRAREELTRMLIMICLIFIVCQLFNPIRRIWEAVTTEEGECSAYDYFAPFVAVMVMFNSAVNFPIYMLCGTRFRNTIVKMFTCRRSTKVEPLMTTDSYSLDGVGDKSGPSGFRHVTGSVENQRLSARKSRSIRMSEDSL